MNDVHREAAEAATKIRGIVEAERSKIYRAEAEARDKVEAEIKEKADKMRKAREAR